MQAFRDREIGLGITDVNTRFGGAFPAPMYAALPGRTYPELIVRMARGEEIEPHVGEFRAGVTFTRYYWQLELDARVPADGARHRRAAGPTPSSLTASTPSSPSVLEKAPPSGLFQHARRFSKQMLVGEAAYAPKLGMRAYPADS